MDAKLKKSVRKRAKAILGTYMNDGNIMNKDNPMIYYFSAVKYILTYGIN
jgi:hypothetical protein